MTEWLWFLLVGSTVGLFLGHPVVGGLAGLGAWAVRRRFLQQDGEGEER